MSALECERCGSTLESEPRACPEKYAGLCEATVGHTTYTRQPELVDSQQLLLMRARVSRLEALLCEALTLLSMDMKLHPVERVTRLRELAEEVKGGD